MYACLGAGPHSPRLPIASRGISRREGFLLCGDGLWENVDKADLEAIFKAKDLAGALRSVVSRARTRGGEYCDNISVAAVRRVD